MSILINAKELQSALSILSKVLPKSTNIEAIKGIKFEIYYPNVILTSSDENNTLQVVVPNINQEQTEPLSFIVPGKELVLLSKSFTDNINIKLMEDYVEMENQGKIYVLSTIKPEDYPSIPQHMEQILEIDTKSLQEGLEKVAFCVDPKINENHFKGILLDITKNNINFVGTDRFRMAVKSNPINVKQPDSILLYPKTISILLWLIKQINVDNIKISTDDIPFFTQFCIGNILYTSRLNTSVMSFPEYISVIPDEKDKPYAIIDAAELLVSAKKTKLNKKQDKIVMTFSKRHCNFKINDTEILSSNIECNIKQLSICLPLEKVMKFLQIVNKDNNNKIKVIPEKKGGPVLFYPVSEPSYKFVTMPINQ